MDNKIVNAKTYVRNCKNDGAVGKLRWRGRVLGWRGYAILQYSQHKKI